MTQTCFQPRVGVRPTAATPTGTSPVMHVVLDEQGVTLKSLELPSAGHAEVRTVAADPEAACALRRRSPR